MLVVEQFGLATMKPDQPRCSCWHGMRAVWSGFISGMSKGTLSVMRNAEALVTTA